MGTLTRQKIQDFYEQFKSIAVSFNKEVIQVTGLQPRLVSIKCGSDFFPCVVISSSFEETKLVANIKSGLLEKLKETNNSASLKFSFKVPSSGEQVAFLVPCHFSSSSPYKGSQDMSMCTLQYSQRPPDDLIEILGRVLDASLCATKRKDEAIPITPEILRKLRFATKDIGVTVQGVPRRSILKDISFGGARVVVLGVSKLLINKEASVKFEFSDPEEVCQIFGTFVEAEPIAERKDMVVLRIVYNDPVPMMYKVRLSEYLNSARSVDRRAQAPQAEAAASETPAPAVAAPSVAAPPVAPDPADANKTASPPS